MVEFAVEIYLFACAVACPIGTLLRLYPFESIGVVGLILGLWLGADRRSFRYCMAKVFTLGRYPRPPAPPPPVEAFKVYGADNDDHLWEHHDSISDLSDYLARKHGR